MKRKSYADRGQPRAWHGICRATTVVAEIPVPTPGTTTRGMPTCSGGCWAPPGSACHARRADRDVVKRQGHRDAAVVTHQGDHVGDADMVEGLDGAVVEATRDPEPE